MSKYLEKLRHFRTAISQNGGLKGSVLSLFRTDEIKWGTQIGVDKYGNKYFENKEYMMGRSRWVVFTDAVGHDYDASQVPAEWHRWLHYIGDAAPTVEPPTPRKFIIPHTENQTGLPGEYVPYSTVPPKIQAWQPPQAK